MSTVWHEHFLKNETGRDFIIGDLHGCYDLLKHTLETVDFCAGEDDRLFSVGDLIDRGTQSMRCLGLYQEGWFHGVQGNHEDMMTSTVLGGVPGDYIWYVNGGVWAKDADPDELRALAEYVDQNVPVVITVDTDDGLVGICHAEPPTNDWADALEFDTDRMVKMLWGRTWLKRGDITPVDNVYRTYHGHTPMNEVTTLGNAWFIDTGAYHTGKLTMAQIQGCSPGCELDDGADRR